MVGLVAIGALDLFGIPSFVSFVIMVLYAVGLTMGYIVMPMLVGKEKLNQSLPAQYQAYKSKAFTVGTMTDVDGLHGVVVITDTVVAIIENGQATEYRFSDIARIENKNIKFHTLSTLVGKNGSHLREFIINGMLEPGQISEAEKAQFRSKGLSRAAEYINAENDVMGEMVIAVGVTFQRFRSALAAHSIEVVDVQ